MSSGGVRGACWSSRTGIVCAAEGDGLIGPLAGTVSRSASQGNRRGIAVETSIGFVMKDGMVFKQNGVMTRGELFNCGPVRGWRIR